MALKKYDLEIVESAEKDINDICSYLADTFENPQAAQTFLLEFQKNVSGLRDSPYMFQRVDEEPYFSFDIRKFCIGKYIVFYKINELFSSVLILRVLHGHRVWQDLL